MLGMSLPSFKLLLHGARACLQAIAGGNCGLVGKAGAHAACDEPAPLPTRRFGLTGGLGVSELLALRATLLEGLGL